MNDFISKPFEPEALIRCVRRHGEHAQGQTGLAAVAVAAVAPTVDPGLAHRLPAAWPRIEGIDAVDAFDRLGGDAELLRSVLRRLLAEFGDLGREGGVPPADRTGLAQRLHKLRGSAGMIGATAIGALAADGEEALATGATARAAAAMEALGAALRDLQHAAGSFVGVDGGDDGSPTGDAAPVADAEDRALLVEALRMQSMGALALFEEIAPGLRSTLKGDRFAKLQRAVQDLRFREAAELLEEESMPGGSP